MGLMKWIVGAAVATVAAPLVIPLMLAGDMSGIDGYNDDC